MRDLATHAAPPGRGAWAAERPYATIVLVAASCAAWVVAHAEPDLYLQMAIIGPLHGDWWKLFTNEFAYIDGVYAFVAIVAVAIFGWLFERRHGPAVVLALFLGAGATGALVASAVYPDPIVSGGNGAALALLAAWAAPDLESARARRLLRGRPAGRGGDRRAAVGDPVRASGGELAGGRHRRGAGPGGRARHADRLGPTPEPSRRTYDGRAMTHDQRGGADRGRARRALEPRRARSRTSRAWPRPTR